MRLTPFKAVRNYAARYVHRRRLAKTNLERLECISYTGSQNWSGYGQETGFLGLSKKASTYHHLVPMLGMLYGWHHQVINRRLILLGVLPLFCLAGYVFIFEALLRIPRVAVM